MSSIFPGSPTTALIEAIDFLTRPLCPTVEQYVINSVQQMLLSTLTTLPTWLHNPRLTLTFSRVCPPRAVYAVCIATRLDWKEWFNALLGGREFDLVIERDLVAARVTGDAETIIIWKCERERDSFPRFPISDSSAGPLVRAPISTYSHFPGLNKSVPPPPPRLTTSSKTIAQQILQSDHEKEEADEIFALISNFNTSSFAPDSSPLGVPALLTPTALSLLPRNSRCGYTMPEEEMLHSRPTFRQPVFSPISSPESSRPSSPVSSTWSSRYSSSQESLLASTSSMSACFSPTSSPPSSPVKTASCVPHSHPPSHSYPPILPSCSTVAVTSVTTKAKANTNKVQRYLYQGGLSTTLTGGVMLGSAAPIIARVPSAASTTTTRPSFASVAAAGVTTKYQHHTSASARVVPSTRKPQQESRLKIWMRPAPVARF